MSEKPVKERPDGQYVFNGEGFATLEDAAEAIAQHYSFCHGGYPVPETRFYRRTSEGWIGGYSLCPVELGRLYALSLAARDRMPAAVVKRMKLKYEKCVMGGGVGGPPQWGRNDPPFNRPSDVGGRGFD